MLGEVSLRRISPIRLLWLYKLVELLEAIRLFGVVQGTVGAETFATPSPVDSSADGVRPASTFELFGVPRSRKAKDDVEGLLLVLALVEFALAEEDDEGF